MKTPTANTRASPGCATAMHARPRTTRVFRISSPERLRPWLLPSVFQRLTLGQTDFLAELRPAAVMLLRAGGFHFDSEAHAG